MQFTRMWSRPWCTAICVFSAMPPLWPNARISLDQERPQIGLSHRCSRSLLGHQPLMHLGDARNALSLRSQRPAA
jgi:hypothetical protein